MTSPSGQHGGAHKPGVIEIRVSELAQLFNSLDPSPFPDKDLDDDAEEFIISWAKELPRHSRLLLRVRIAATPAEPDATATTREAVAAHFEHRREMAQLRFRRLMADGRLSLVIGLAFMATCVIIAEGLARFGSGPFIEILQTSFVIGGWVAMWRPLEILLYDWWPLLRERRIFQRLSDADVEIVVGANHAPR